MSPQLTRGATPLADDLPRLRALREALSAAQFTVERVESVLGTPDLGARPVERIVHRRRLDGQDGFGALARLFLLGDVVDRAELEPALAGFAVEGLVELGLCALEASAVRPNVMLAPHGDYYLACDANAPVGAETPFDYVPGVQAPSVTLAKLTVRQPVESALDLGTGSGLQALLAAKHCRSVVATDVNERALAFARFNARLNGVDNVELRHGPTFTPVPDERFDLVVANPPYVISPEYAYAYRDSDVPGDELCRHIVQEMPDRLNEGAFAHVLVSWAHPNTVDWAAPLREWVSGGGCDAWLLHYRTSDPLDHAYGWLRPLGERDPVAFEAALENWLSYLRNRRIDAISYGAVVLRRRARGPNWIAEAQLPLERLEPASEHVQRAFFGGQLATSLDDAALLEQTLRLTARNRITQVLGLGDGSFEVKQAALELGDGLRPSLGIDRYTMLMLPHLDGQRTLVRALSDAAAQLDLTEEGRRQFVPAALPVIRRLLELGYFEASEAPVRPAGSPSRPSPP